MNSIEAQFGPALRATAVLALLVVGPLIGRANAQTPQNWAISLPTPNDGNSQTSFTVQFNGDVVGLIGAAQLAFPGENSVSTSYQGGFTTVVFSGGAIAPATSVNFGLSLGPGVLSAISSAYWSDGTKVPVLQIRIDPVVAPTTSYETVYLDYDPPGSSPVGQWYEFPYVSGNPPPLILTNPNPSGDTLHFLGSGSYFFSDTQIPLQDLNPSLDEQDAPAGTTYQSFGAPPPLRSGHSEEICTPEPAPVVRLAGLLVVGLVGLAWRRRRRTGAPMAGERPLFAG